MPTGPAELHTKWKSDYNALEFLKKNFINNRGILKLRDKNYAPTLEEFSALNYLFLEWDYTYDLTVD